MPRLIQIERFPSTKTKRRDCTGQSQKDEEARNRLILRRQLESSFVLRFSGIGQREAGQEWI
jgi:hypothetical protein